MRVPGKNNLSAEMDALSMKGSTQVHVQKQMMSPATPAGQASKGIMQRWENDRFGSVNGGGGIVSSAGYVRKERTSTVQSWRAFAQGHSKEPLPKGGGIYATEPSEEGG